MKIGLLGAHGRMGTILSRLLKEEKIDVVELLFDEVLMKEQLKSCQGVIEFSSKEGLEMLLKVAEVPCVLAATGLDESQKNLILKKA